MGLHRHAELRITDGGKRCLWETRKLLWIPLEFSAEDWFQEARGWTTSGEGGERG